ncbi:MAG: M48 family metallopeptidase [Parachlamydia sp.]|nr:M48 family metallopeptidase [Parachlamydia sp.]
MDRNSFGGRLVVGLIIAAVAWMMYMNQVEVNPVTGEKQHVSISPKQEVRLGLESAPQMSREMGGELPAGDPRTQEVKKMGAFLLSKSDAQNSPWQFQFHLLADPNTVNAFALPGGQVFITLGLYNRIDTEAELAGVLGHEMGHVIERHTAQQMAKSQFGKLLVVAVGAAASDSGQSSQGGYSPLVLASMVNQMIQLRYSRGDESQADTWGLQIMQQAGFDPNAMIQVMEVLKSVGGGKSVPQIYQTHPDPDKRIRDIKAYLQEHPPKPGLSQGRKLKTLSYFRNANVGE